MLKEKRYNTISNHNENENADNNDDDSTSFLDQYQPNIIVKDGLFHIVIFGWAKLSSKLTDEGVRRVMVLLDLMKEESAYNVLQQETVPPSLDTTNLPLLAAPKIDEEDYTTTTRREDGRTITCQPSVKSYNILLTDLANASHLDVT